MACTTDPVVLSDTNNFTYSGDVHVPSIPTIPAEDLDICWDEVLLDIQCHDLDPVEDVDMVSLVRFLHLTEDEVAEKIGNDGLQQADMSGYVEWENTGETCTELSALSFRGTVIDVPAEYTLDGGTYLLTLATGGTLGSGTRMLSFLTPTAESDNTRVDVGDGCGVLDFDADLASLAPVKFPDEGPWEIDWSTLTRTGLGNTLLPSDIDGLSLAFYAGSTRSELQQSFLDLELIADELYGLPISGTLTADLTQATTEEGTTAFSGLTGDGTWLLALTCSRCANPAPLFLSAMETSE